MCASPDVFTCSKEYPHAYNNGASCCNTDASCGAVTFSYAGSCCAGTSEECLAAADICYSAAVDGGWSDWVNGTCTETCGDGLLDQIRACDNPSPANGGQNCVGDVNQAILPCNDGTCSGIICVIQPFHLNYDRICLIVHGNWTEWAPVTTCSESCGPGFLNESRSCTNPAPANGGADCVGDEEREVACEIAPCPGKKLLEK